MSQQRVILVTGANKGIGLEVVKQLSSKFPQDIVLLGTRDLNNGEQAIKQSSNDSATLSNVKVIQIDVTKPESIKAAVSKIESEYGRLDILISNSGISILQHSLDAAKHTFDVNVFGVQRMNDACLPLLKKSSKPIIIVVGSETGAWFNHWLLDDKLKQLILSPEQWSNDTFDKLTNDFIALFDKDAKTEFSWETEPGKEIYKIYSASKAIIAGYSAWYARQHPEIEVAIVTPGYCATEMNNFSGWRTAAKGAESVVWHVDNKFKSGHFYRDGEELELMFASDLDK